MKSGLKFIDKYDFALCDSLQKVYLPSSLDTIGECAFAYSKQFSDLYFDGSQTQWNAVGKALDWNDYVADNFKQHWHCTVIYNANGHGTAPNPVAIQWSNEDKLDEPTAPTAEGYNFRGWYTEPECTNPWDFANFIIPGDMTLYAKWEPVVVSKPGDANGDGNVDVQDVTAIINRILGNNPNPFDDTNADVNGDGNIDVLDVTAVINMILGIH